MNDTQHFTIYSTPGCPWCQKAKDLCVENNATYSEFVVGRDIERDEFFEKFPGVKSAPFILQQDKVVGGYVELSNLLS
jgi:glutaredoxin 3